ncbi:Uncharacterised protein [uncultured Actinomyces sp.]|nr:Uncharacterised protein [uncultured Actinomyces sp.]
MGQDVVGHDLRQRCVACVADREAVGAVGARVDLGDLAGRNEVGVLIALDFLRDCHTRGRGDRERHAGIAQEVCRRTVLVEVERVLSATVDAVLEVTHTTVLVIGLRSATRHERPCGVRRIASGGGGEDISVVLREERAFNRIRDDPANQGAAGVVEVLFHLDLHLGRVVGGAVRVLQDGVALRANAGRVVHVEALGQQVHDRERRGGAAVNGLAGLGNDHEASRLAHDDGVGAQFFTDPDTGYLGSDTGPATRVVLRDSDGTRVLVRDLDGRAVLDTDVVLGGHGVVVRLRGQDRVVAARKICGFGLRNASRNLADQVDSRPGQRGSIGLNDEASDPLAVRQGESAGVLVGHRLVVALVGPVLEGPTTDVLISGLGGNLELVGTDEGGLIAGVARGLAVLGGPGAGHNVFPAEVHGRVAVVTALETPGKLIATRVVAVVGADLLSRGLDPALGEAVRDLGALGHDVRRLVHTLGRDGRRVGDHVRGRDRALGVLDGHGGSDGVLVRPLVVRPRDGVGGRVVDAAVRGGHEDGLRGQRVDDLDVLHLLEADTDELAVVSGATPAATDLVRIGRVVLLVAVVQLVRGLATDGGVVQAVRRAVLLDSDVGRGSPGRAQRLLDAGGIVGRENDVLRGGGVVRRIIAVVVPRNLDAVRRAGGQRILQREAVALHARPIGRVLDEVLALRDNITGDGDDRVALLDELEPGRSDRAGQGHLDDGPLARSGHRRAREVDRRNLLVANSQGGGVVDDGHGQSGGLVAGGGGGNALGVGGFVGGLRVGRGCGSFLRRCHVGCLRAFVGGAGSHGEGCQRRDEKRESGQTGSTRNTHTGAERTQSRHRLLLLWGRKWTGCLPA